MVYIIELNRVNYLESNLLYKYMYMYIMHIYVYTYYVQSLLFYVLGLCYFNDSYSQCLNNNINK